MRNTKTNNKPTATDKRALQALVDTDYFAEYVDFIQSPWKAFLYSFLRGTGFAFGTIIGVAILIALVAYIIQLFSGVPIIGSWVMQLGEIVHIQ